MNVINNYFEFKKQNLISYALIFFDNEKKYTKYIEAFINTYINCYYYHITDTYYEKVVTNYDDKVIVKELKGKQLELIQEDESNKKMIEDCYKYSSAAIILDLTNFSNFNKLEEFREKIRANLVDKNLILENEEIIEKLGVLVKDNTLKERKFFNSLQNDTFNINYYSYKDNNKNYRVDLEYSINQLEKNYTKNVLDKNFLSDKIKYDKLVATANLVQIDLLRKIISNKELANNYFIDCPLTGITKKKDLENIVTSFSNDRIRNNIVFIIKYGDYVNHKSFFKDLNNYNFAIMVDFSRVIVIDKRLSEIESFDTFRYVIVDGVKKDNYQLIENYVMKDKEMFMNELNMM